MARGAEYIAANILRLIEERGTSRRAVANAAGVAESSFYRKVGSNPGAFTIPELVHIADALDTTLSDLFTEPKES